MGVLPCMHFPHVSVAEHIRGLGKLKACGKAG